LITFFWQRRLLADADIPRIVNGFGVLHSRLNTSAREIACAAFGFSDARMPHFNEARSALERPTFSNPALSACLQSGRRRPLLR
jgi:hypothetical protein